jgi:hypothetical protein
MQISCGICHTRMVYLPCEVSGGWWENDGVETAYYIHHIWTASLRYGASDDLLRHDVRRNSYHKQYTEMVSPLCAPTCAFSSSRRDWSYDYKFHKHVVSDHCGSCNEFSVYLRERISFCTTHTHDSSPPCVSQRVTSN